MVGLSNSLLDNLPVRPRLGKGAHIHEVGAGETFHLREGVAQVVGQPVDDLGAPALFGLPGQNIAADLPI
jgi:hypothetical protein